MSDVVVETKRGQVPSIDVLENKIESLRNAIERGREAQTELPIVESKLEALLSDPEYRAKLQKKAARMVERANRLVKLAETI